MWHTCRGEWMSPFINIDLCLWTAVRICCSLLCVFFPMSCSLLFCLCWKDFSLWKLKPDLAWQLRFRISSLMHLTSDEFSVSSSSCFFVVAWFAVCKMCIVRYLETSKYCPSLCSTLGENDIFQTYSLTSLQSPNACLFIHFTFLYLYIIYIQFKANLNHYFGRVSSEENCLLLLWLLMLH